MSVRLFGEFLERVMGATFGGFPPERGDPWEVARLLSPFHDALLVEPAKSYVLSNPYDPSGETTFDLALERLAANPEAGFDNGTNAALTVWHERLHQALVVLATNAAEGRQVILPPTSLDEMSRQVAAACLWLHEMELPFAPGTVRPLSPPGRA